MTTTKPSYTKSLSASQAVNTLAKGEDLGAAMTDAVQDAAEEELKSQVGRVDMAGRTMSLFTPVTDGFTTVGSGITEGVGTLGRGIGGGAETIGRGIKKGYTATTSLVGLGPRANVLARLKSHFESMQEGNMAIVLDNPEQT